MQGLNSGPAARRLSPRSSVLVDVLRYKCISSWHKAFYRSFPVRLRIWNVWCIWSMACRSFCGHIESQSAKQRLTLDVGPALEPFPDVSTSSNKRTLARMRGIENLSAKYPWADIPDRRIFLEGFDAGEQWAQNKLDIESKIPAQT